ncbi:MAG: hypothetical protein WBD40_19595 [Tepidisphaeraceae bacterium]
MSGTTASPIASAPTRLRGATQPFAWQGWLLHVPASWNPLKLEGDFDTGYALLADMDGPRLGLRWQAVDGKQATPECLKRVIRDEVGADPSESIGDAFAYLDPEPPGRDVAVKWSATSDRLIQIAYHVRRRDRVLADEILPTIVDASARPMRPWATFDLACATPADLTLRSHRLFAGDLMFDLAGRARFVALRQVALAELALKRMPLDRWLAEQLRGRRVTHRTIGAASAVKLRTEDGRELIGLVAFARRRRRFFWKVGLHAECVSLALHDATRDRLVFLEASNESLAHDVARTVGCDLRS